jgi:hypothetical protein
MKKLMSGLLFFLLSSTAFSQSLDPSYVQDAVRTVEDFLNDRPCLSSFELLSVHEWDPNFHSGHSPGSVDYVLDVYPYSPTRDHGTRDRRNRIAITVAPDRTMIVVYLTVAGRAYGFHSLLEEGRNGLTISEVPDEVLERD